MSGTTPKERLTPVSEAAGPTVYYDDCADTYHTWWDETEYEPVSTALIMAVASVRDVQLETLDSLSDCVDPDALNGIFSHWRGDRPRLGNGSISFTFAECAVTIRSNGEIIIDPIDDENGSQRCYRAPV